jgi:hypothetical protein
VIPKKIHRFITENKKYYKSIGSVSCPAFPFERIYFNKHGLNHMIRSKGNVRRFSDQMRRMRLFKHAVSILEACPTTKWYKFSYKKKERGLSIARFWSCIGYREGKKITVLVRQLNDSPKHYFSINDKISIKRTNPVRGPS